MISTFFVNIHKGIVEKKMEIHCPLCKKEITKEKIFVHFKLKCPNKNNTSFYQYACLVKGKEFIDNLISLYKSGTSLNDIKSSSIRNTLSDISERVWKQIFSELNIKIRNVKESKNTTVVKEKCQQTCENKYGKGIINVSQVLQIKQKKAETFIKHYGVDNIRKYKPYYNQLNDFMIKKYGKKRLSGKEGKTQQELEEIEIKRIHSRIKNGWFDSLLEERVDKIMTENNIIHQRCFWAYHHPYDFIFGDHILLEVNGDFWHANPLIYKASDLMINGKTAEDIWNYDKKFRDCLIGSKFKLIYLWESQMNCMSDNEIVNWLKDYL